MTEANAFAELRRRAESQFDPRVVEAFIETMIDREIADETRAA